MPRMRDESAGGRLIGVHLTTIESMSDLKPRDKMQTSPQQLPDLDKLWDFDDPAATEAKFRSLLPSARGSSNKDYLIQLLTQIARAQGLQRRFEEAHATLDEAAASLEPGMTVCRVRYLLERGRVLNSANDKQKASPLFNEAWQLAREAGEDFYAVDAAHMLGICEPPESALAWNERAMEVAEKSPQPRAQGWLGSLYNNIGWTYHDLGRYERALEMFTRAQDYWRKRQNPDRLRIARWTVARAMRSLGRFEDSLAMQQQLDKEADETGQSKVYIHEELGECLLALGREAEAKPYFAQAYRELSKDPWLAANEPARLQRLEQLMPAAS